MKIAIHHKLGSFSERWIEYCKKNAISYKIVNAYDSNIIEQVKGCDVFMWHHHHADFKDVLTAKKILFALEHAGIKVFPDFKTGWHFDDKVAQKYLLEAIEAPVVPSFVFYEKQKALDWAESTDYPKVFKLKGGAGSSNVKLVKNKKQCVRLINKAFGSGFAQNDYLYEFKDRIKKYKAGKMSAKQILSPLYRLVFPRAFDKMSHKEKGYVYFQEFIPNNDSDTRIVIVGNYAVAEKRFVRKGDFRASGSGEFSYDNINLKAIGLAFEISKRLKVQCVAFDFVFDENDNPLIVEMSYGFGTTGLNKAPGYWDSSLNWHEGKFNPQEWMLNHIIK